MMCCFVLIMSSTYYVCCIYSNDSHVSKQYARSCLICFHIVCNKGNLGTPEDEQKQQTDIVNSGKGVKLTLKLDCIHYVHEQTVRAKTKENDLSTQRILFLYAWKALMPYICNYMYPFSVQ